MKKTLLVTTFLLLALTSCGKNMESTTSTSESAETTITNADRGDASGEIVNNEKQEQQEQFNKDIAGENNALDTLNPDKEVTKNEDGTYTFSEEFLSTLSTYDFFTGASPELIDSYLQSLGDMIVEASESDLHMLLQGLSGVRLTDIWYEPTTETPVETPAEKPVEQQKPVETPVEKPAEQPSQSSPSSDGNTSGSTSGNSGGGFGNAAADGWNVDTDSSNFGGGGQDNTGASLYIP